MKWLWVVVVVACSSRDPQPLGPQVTTAAAKPQSNYERLEAAMPGLLDALEKLGESLRAANGDCTQLAKVLRAFADKHAAKLPELAELMEKLTQQERERFELEHHDDRERLQKVFAATSFDCPGNTEVEAALQTAGFRKKQP